MKPVSARARVSLFFPDDIKTFPALTLESDGPLLKVPERFFSYLGLEEKTEVEYFDADGRKSCAAEIVSSDGRSVLFHLAGEPEELEESLYHSVDYKGFFTVAPVEEGKEIEFFAMAERINSAEKNDLGRKLREAIAGGSEDGEMLGFLSDINAKLDRILAILNPEPGVSGSFSVRGVSVSGGGFSFYSEKTPASGKIFATALLEGAGRRVRFASLCSLNRVAGNIWRAGFIDPDETARDEIVRFVFAKEREILKEARL